MYAKAMNLNTPVARAPLTGCVGRFPMVDRNGVQLHVGDKIRAQVCVGRYGRTQLVETVVTNAHEMYGTLYSGGTSIPFAFRDGVLVGYNRHFDFDHGHETWVQILPAATAH